MEPISNTDPKSQTFSVQEVEALVNLHESELNLWEASIDKAIDLLGEKRKLIAGLKMSLAEHFRLHPRDKRRARKRKG